MKSLLTITTSIVAASLAMGMSTSANAQGSTVTLSGDISLGWTGFDRDSNESQSPLGGRYQGTNDGQTGNFDMSFDVSAAVPEYGATVFAYADLTASTDLLEGMSTQLGLESAAIGISSFQGALLARVGARETEFAYASDLAVGGAGVSRKFQDEEYGSQGPFGGIELIYANASGPFSYSAAYEIETGKVSGAAGYDFATLYGPARINGYVFKDQMIDFEPIDEINGFRIGAFVDNGRLEFGGNISVENIDMKHVSAMDIDRTSFAVGASFAVHSHLDLSVDYEYGDVDINRNRNDYTYNAVSVGAEWALGDAMTVGGHVKHMNQMPSFNTASFAANSTLPSPNQAAIIDTMDGTQVGLNVGVSF